MSCMLSTRHEAQRNLLCTRGTKVRKNNIAQYNLHHADKFTFLGGARIAGRGEGVLSLRRGGEGLRAGLGGVLTR